MTKKSIEAQIALLTRDAAKCGGFKTEVRDRLRGYADELRAWKRDYGLLAARLRSAESAERRISAKWSKSLHRCRKAYGVCSSELSRKLASP